MQIITKLKGLNVRGASHHFLFPVLAVLLVAGIGGFVMQRSSSAATKVFITSNGKSCVQRSFMLNSRSACVGFAQSIMKIKSDSVFGPNTRNKLKQVTGSTALNSTSWKKLCNNAKSSNRTLWTKAGCGGQGTNTYLSKSSTTATNSGYRWGYFNCYPTSKVYPAKPVWACQRKWVKKSETINTATKAKPVWAIKSAQTSVKRRHTQFSYDTNAYSYSKSMQSQSLNEWANSRCRSIGSVKVKKINGKNTSYCLAKKV